MFNNSSSGKMKRAKRLTWLTLPFSLLLHALVIAGLVVVPLLRADVSLPQVKVIPVLITAPAPPPPPAKGPGKTHKDGGNVNGEKNGKGTKDPRQPIPSGPWKAPYDVPDTIKEEAIDTGVVDRSLGDGEGIPEGVEGVEPGSALLGLDDGKTVNDLQTAVHVPIVQIPRKIREVKPVYSSIAIAAHVQGRVIIEAMTDIYGRVRSARIISSASPLLNEEALQAVKQWLYEPYFLNGIPKPVVFTVTITFTLAQ